MKRKSKSQNSKFQQNFQAQLTFKRNKRYIDLDKIHNIQQEYSVRRRKPLKNDDDQLLTKIHSSFLNSTVEMTERISHNINKYKNRLSCSQSHLSFQGEQQPRNSSSQKSRSFSIEKMTSREYIHNLKNKPVLDERLFNNYCEQKPDLAHTSDFSKRQGKKLDNRLKHMNDIYHQTQKLYEQYYYKKTTNQTKVNYKAERKQKPQRVFYVDKRPQNKPATDMNLEKVDQGAQIATHYKGSNIKQSKTDVFYMNSGRQLPCQFDMRNMTELTNYWKGENGVIERPQLDFEQAKMKDDLVEERKDKFKKSKRGEILRNEVCDNRFFKYNKNN